MTDESHPDNPSGTPTSGPDPQAETVKGDSPPASMPRKIGRYTVRRVIASGGMGTVYLAVQEQPHRTVALNGDGPVSSGFTLTSLCPFRRDPDMPIHGL